MSSSTVDTINFASTTVYIYGCIFIIIVGLLSNFINILLFSSKNYRTNPCSFYLMTTEMSNLINLLVYVLPTVVGLITGQNGTETYAWWCKLLNYFGNHLMALSIITLCLASMDRYHCTSRNARQRNRSSMKVTKISILVAVIASLLLAIPELLYRGIDSSYGIPMCIKISSIYNLYLTYFFNPVYIILPIILLSVIGILTYRNIKSARHVNPVNTIHNVNLVKAVFSVPRLVSATKNDGNAYFTLNESQKLTIVITNKQRIDRQFSTILIIQILYFSFTTIPLCIRLIYSTVTKNDVKGDMSQAIEGLFTAITYVISCAPFSSSFYIYYLLSSTYRQNVNKMLSKTSQMLFGPMNTM